MLSLGYDTIFARLEGRDSPDVSALTPDAEKFTATGARSSRSYRWGNLSVRLDAGGLFIGGSVPKFLHGQNIASTSPGGLRDAVELWSDTLHVPMKEGKVVRLDLAATLGGLSHPVPAYLARLDYLPRFERYEQGRKGVLFKQVGQQLSVYDKAREVGRSKLPDDLRGQNLARYERRWVKRVQSRFEKITPVLTLGTLTDPETFRPIAGLWHAGYTSIRKRQMPSIGSYPTQKRCSDYIFACGVDALGGIGRTLDVLKSAQPFQDRQHYARAREMVRKRYALAAKSESTDELMLEFDRAIERAMESVQ